MTNAIPVRVEATSGPDARTASHEQEATSGLDAQKASLKSKASAEPDSQKASLKSSASPGPDAEKASLKSNASSGPDTKAARLKSGLWNEKSVFGGFEVSLRHEFNVNPQDCLNGLKSFSRWGLPVPCLPMVWVYGSSDAMPMARPFVMIEVPINPQHSERWHCTQWSEFAKCGFMNLQYYVLIHEAPKRAPSQSFDHGDTECLEEVNLSHHAWLLEGLDEALKSDPDLSIVTSVETGVYNPNGVSEAHQRVKSKEARGLKFGEMEKREVSVHGGGCFSPCNNMLRLDRSHIFHSFMSMSVGKGHKFGSTDEKPLKGAMIFHIIPAHDVAEQALREAVGEVQDLGEMIAMLNAYDKQMAVSFRRFVEDCAPEDGLMMWNDHLSSRQKYHDFVARQAKARGSELQPWRPPEKTQTANEGHDMVALAVQLMDMGYADFDFNLEVLAKTNGNLEMALQFLEPA